MNSITTIRMDPMLDRKCWAERGKRKRGEGGREEGRRAREDEREGERVERYPIITHVVLGPGSHSCKLLVSMHQIWSYTPMRLCAT